MGTAITPGNNTYGTPVTLISGANLTVDCCELTICVNSVGLTTLTRNAVVSLLIDPAGGTTFTTLADLLVGPASAYSANGNSGGGGVWLRFPLWLKAGSTIGMAAQVNSATLTAINAFCRVRGEPSHPDANFYVGQYIDSFGVTLATSSGTVITQGSASEGAYTQIGTLTRPIYWWDFGYAVDDASMSNNTLDVDIAIGDATNKKQVIINAPVHTSTIEALSKGLAGEWGIGATNDGVFARSQGNVGVDTSNSIAVYGVGG